MKSETIILLLLECISCGVNACTHGDIRITGVSSDKILAGWVDFCYESEWRIVCQHLCDRNDAMVVCREFGFPTEDAQFCINSCLGRNDSLKGINEFLCSGRENRVVECQPLPYLLSGRCGHTIGVICYNSDLSVFNPANSLLPTTSTASTNTVLCQNTTAQNQQDADTEVDGNTTEATLGGLLGVLLIVLVGVVIGWVWTCCKIKKMKFASRPQVNTLSNISYNSSSFPLHTAGQGPRKKSRNNTSIISPEKMQVPERNRRIYEVPVEGNYEDVYYELENTREGKRRVK